MATPVKIKAIVTKVIKHTSEVVSYEFAPEGRVPKFHPGQFLHLTLSDYQGSGSWPESRVFSIASAQSERRKCLGITMSVKGTYTRRIYDELHEGSGCWLKLPYGEFLFERDKPLVLVAGGVGITPFLSLFYRLLEEKSLQLVQLYYGVRTSELYIFSELIKQCEMELPNFHSTIYCENNTIGDKQGMLDIVVIHADAPQNALFYLSGPSAMITTFRSRLYDLEVHKNYVCFDDWE